MLDAISPPKLLIRQAQLLDGSLVGVRLAEGNVVELAPALSPSADERVIEAGGGLLLPGLWDHHMHLLGTAAAQASIICGPPAVHSDVELEQTLRDQAAITPTGEWLRGVGFHDSVCPSLDRQWLDRVCPEHPVRIQHRSGMLWVYNSLAIAQLGMDDHASFPEGVERDGAGVMTGRFYNLDAWLGERLPKVLPAVAPLSQALARSGVIGVTDTGVNNHRDTYQLMRQLQEQGRLLQRVQLMGCEDLLLADTTSASRLQIGPLKLYLREFDLPDLEQWTARIAASHRCGRTVAIHCVTLAELYFALAGLEEAGVMLGDRIEHASIADDGALEKIRELGLTVVSQPHFIAERGVQYAQDVAPDELPWLYRAASFVREGIPYAAGSDAPYGDIDPWSAMAAAVSRKNSDGTVMGADERLTPEQALNLYLGDPRSPAAVRRVAEGEPADLCLLDCDWTELSQDLSARHVRLTLCGGRVIYERDQSR